MNFADQILNFLFTLKISFNLPKNVEVLDAHKREDVQKICTLFYKKYYNDNKKRHALIGINPGRFGGGITGIPFTDPVRLEKICDIKTEFQKKQELSSVFIYEMIEAFGGTEKFYKQFYFSAISPLGFVKHGKNLNYYDDKVLMKRIEPFVIDCMKKQIDFGLKTDICFCIGEGENFEYFQKLNSIYNWFTNIETVPHPRFIMQYKFKKKNDYIDIYLKKLRMPMN